VRRWLIGYGQRRIERELREYEHPPEIRVAPFFKRRPAQQRTQIFRSLVQVNFYPRPR
jgi:hypothetical protein